MCSHYQAIKEQEKYHKHFGVLPPPEGGKLDLWPGYLGPFIRKHLHADAGDEAVPRLEAINGLFGLVPHWATDTKITRSTYNCRSETAAEKPSFRDAFKRDQRCIIPANTFYEPDWRSGKAVSTQIAAVDSTPFGIAGLWSSWKDPKNGWVHSYAMLTINADSHALMNHFHKPTDEKRMVVILAPENYQRWLEAKSPIGDFMLPYSTDLMKTIEPLQSNTGLFT